MVELNPLQKRILELFAKSPLAEKFYWTGGTLLSSVYLHHRFSEDIDFFTQEPFRYEQVIGFVGKLSGELKLAKIEEKRIYDRWEFLLYNNKRVRLEFVLYDHPPLKPKRKWKGILIDSLDDIAANKTMALVDRYEPKDLFDLYFLLTRKKYTINSLLKKVEKKFKVKFAESVFWSASLNALRHIDIIKPLVLGSQKQKEKLLAEIKGYFNQSSADFVRRVLK